MGETLRKLKDTKTIICQSMWWKHESHQSQESFYGSIILLLFSTIAISLCINGFAHADDWNNADNIDLFCVRCVCWIIFQKYSKFIARIHSITKDLYWNNGTIFGIDCMRTIAKLQLDHSYIEIMLDYFGRCGFKLELLRFWAEMLRASNSQQ